MAGYRLNTTRYVIKWPKKHKKVLKFNKIIIARPWYQLSSDKYSHKVDIKSPEEAPIPCQTKIICMLHS